MISYKQKEENLMQSMEEIYQQYSNMIYKYLLCLGASPEIAEDLTQETFVIAVKKINQFRGDSKVSSWLCQIAKHLWYQQCKKNKKLSVENLTDEMLNVKGIEEIVCEKEEKLEFFKSMQKLDELARQVVYLRMMGNLSFLEIAEILGKTPNWARVTFFRAKQKIREERENGKKDRM